MNRLNKVYRVDDLLGLYSGHLDGKPMSFFQIDELLKTSIYDYEAGTRWTNDGLSTCMVAKISYFFCGKGYRLSGRFV